MSTTPGGTSGRRRAVVVGGGISGLAAAWELAGRGGADGVDVVLLEASGHLGGPLRTARLGGDGDDGADGGLVVDVGAESLLARRPEAVDLAREVGLGPDLVVPSTTRAAVVLGGRRHPMPRGTVMGVPADPSSLAGLLTAQQRDRATHEQLTPALGEDGDVDVASFVGARLGPAVVDALVEPLLGGVYAGRASGLSLRSVLPALWPAARDGASLGEAVATASRAAGVAGTGAGGGVFAGIRGGVGRLPGAVAAALRERGAVVRTGAAVTGLHRRGGEWHLDVAASPPLPGDHAVPPPPEHPSEHLVADVVVLAVPPSAAAALLAGAAPAAADAIGGVETAGLALVTLLLPPGSLDALVDAEGLPLSGLLVPPSQGRLVKAVTASSRKWAWTAEAAGGREVLRLSVGRRGEQAVLARSDADLLDAVLTDGSDLLGQRLEPLASLVTRWPAALPQPDVGHAARLARVLAEVARQPGLALAGAAVDGVGVPACIAAARRAAGAALGQPA